MILYNYSLFIIGFILLSFSILFLYIYIRNYNKNKNKKHYKQNSPYYIFIFIIGIIFSILIIKNSYVKRSESLKMIKTSEYNIIMYNGILKKAELNMTNAKNKNLYNADKYVYKKYSKLLDKEEKKLKHLTN